MLDKKYKCDMCNKEERKENLLGLYLKSQDGLRKKHEVCEMCYRYIESFINNFDGGK